MRIAVVGLGLIGGSLLRALDRASFDVSGYDADPRVREVVADAGFTVTHPEALTKTDLIVVSIPAPGLPSLLPSLSGFTGIVTDVTSVKGPVAAAVRRYCPTVRYIGGHPMAGKETSGFAAADAELFAGRTWALCLSGSDAHGHELDDWAEVASLLCRLGVRVVPTTAERHDDAVARVSHLPHLLAAALTRTATAPLAVTLSAGSFTDGTRVAASDPYLVSAMCSANARAVEDALDFCLAELQEARDALSRSRENLAEWLTPATTARRALPIGEYTSRTDVLTAAKLLEIGETGGWVEAVDHVKGHVLWAARSDAMP